MSSLLPLPASLRPFLEPYLPKAGSLHVTLTYAQSLDAKIAAGRGLQTAISHQETKTMTHYLRSKHDAIVIGVGTALSDNPGLDCRFNNHQIRPVVVDPNHKWTYRGSRMEQTAVAGKGLAPFIVVATEVSQADAAHLEAAGGGYIHLSHSPTGLAWSEILAALREKSLYSVMVEGGARVINDLLTYKTEGHGVVDSLIVTLGPVYLGDQGVGVSPSCRVSPVRVRWWTGLQDSVMAGMVERSKPMASGATNSE